jgi:hypothetical protein
VYTPTKRASPAARSPGFHPRHYRVACGRVPAASGGARGARGTYILTRGRFGCEPCSWKYTLSCRALRPLVEAAAAWPRPSTSSEAMAEAPKARAAIESIASKPAPRAVGGFTPLPAAPIARKSPRRRAAGRTRRRAEPIHGAWRGRRRGRRDHASAFWTGNPRAREDPARVPMSESTCPRRRRIAASLDQIFPRGSAKRGARRIAGHGGRRRGEMRAIARAQLIA